MNLPKSLTPALIGELNKACESMRDTYKCDCLDIGWCDECWMVVRGEIPMVEKEKE